MKKLKVLRDWGACIGTTEFCMMLMISIASVGGMLQLFDPSRTDDKLSILVMEALLIGLLVGFWFERDSSTFHRVILDISDKGLRYPAFLPFIFKKITWDEIDSVIYEPISGSDGWADGDIIIYVSESAKGRYKTTKVENSDTKEIIEVKTIIINTKEAVLSGNKIYPVILNNLKKSRKKVKVDFSKKI